MEGPSKKDPSMLTGRTRQGKIVHFAPPSGGLRPGAFVDVLVDKASPHHMTGHLTGIMTGSEPGRPGAELAPGRRIPVRALLHVPS